MNHGPRSAVALSMLVVTALAACGEESRDPPPSFQEDLVRAGQPLLTLVECLVGSAAIQYSPPLKNVEQDVTVVTTTVYSNCISLLGGTVTSGTNTIRSFRPGFSCMDLLSIGSSTSVITWNTGETSTLIQTRVSSQINGNLAILTNVGTVESGKFAGATVTRTTTYLSTDLAACDSAEGLSRLSGPATLSLTGLL
ncbi:hypothetical protein ACN47A_35400 [Myxococcus fulvus]|uniref:hypothetical protein n=1 Tax=Myxococcus fulvus TaxID=33 RepID=UPI003B9B0D48